MKRSKKEKREAHRPPRMLAAQGIGARRGHLSRMPAKRESLDESVKTLDQPINKGGCNGLPIIFSCEVERLKERSDLVVVDQNAVQQGQGDWTCRKAAVWKLGHWRASVPWSIPAELLKIHVFSCGRAQKPHKHGIGYKTQREGRQYMSSPIIKHFFV